MAFAATQMDLEIMMLSEINQWDTKSYAITYMWNLKKGHNELLCRTDNDSQTLKNVWFPNETGWGGGGCTGVWGWKCYKTGLWWSLYNYNCNKIHWII